MSHIDGGLADLGDGRDPLGRLDEPLDGRAHARELEIGQPGGVDRGHRAHVVVAHALSLGGVRRADQLENFAALGRRHEWTSVGGEHGSESRISKKLGRSGRALPRLNLTALRSQFRNAASQSTNRVPFALWWSRNEAASTVGSSLSVLASASSSPRGDQSAGSDTERGARDAFGFLCAQAAGSAALLGAEGALSQ